MPPTSRSATPTRRTAPTCSPAACTRWRTRTTQPFVALIDRTGLPFRAYDAFGPEEQQERQELYIRIAEWVWNPSRLDLDGEKPPVHAPIAVLDDEDDAPDRPDRFEARRAFWTRLLDHAKSRSDLHSTISPSKYHWAGTRRDGMWWNYWVTQHETRVTLYIDGPDAAANKAKFDALNAQRSEVERAFGGTLEWERNEDKRASWIGTRLPGGWVDSASWPQAIEQSVDAMGRLYAVLGPLVRDLRGKS